MRVKKKYKKDEGKRKEAGQATIEFLITFVFSLGIFILFLTLALNTSGSYLAHYATYMSGRVYLVADNSSNNIASSDNFAEDEARIEFTKYKNVMLGDARNSFDVRFHPPGSTQIKPVYVGALFPFKQKLSFLSFFGGNNILDLVSEAFLGREPIRSDCLARVCQAMSNVGVGGGCTTHTTLFDNGC